MVKQGLQVDAGAVVPGLNAACRNALLLLLSDVVVGREQLATALLDGEVPQLLVARFGEAET